MSATYPHLSRANDLVYCALYRANGGTLTYRAIYNAHNPGAKFGEFGRNVRTIIRRIRASFEQCGHDGVIVSVPGVGYRLDMAKAPPYCHQIDRVTHAEPPKRRITIIPRPQLVYNLDPTGWVANRFTGVV